MLRFWRNNTGHSGPHCFRSLAVQTDADGRFKFLPWKQADTRANYAIGEVKAYKAGFGVPRGIDVTQRSRSIGPIPLSDTITIPKTYVRIELKPFAGTDQERMWELRRLASHFTCRWQAEFDDVILLYAIRDEINSSPLANAKATPEGGTPYHLDPTWSRWIEVMIKGW